MQSSLHDTDPEGAIGSREHGIDRIAGDTARIAWVVLVELQLQEAWHQLGDASRLRAHPYLSVLGIEAIHEVAAQWTDRTIAVPVLDVARLVVEDIHATERTYQEFVVWRHRQTSNHLVLQGVVGRRAVVLLLGAIV